MSGSTFLSKTSSRKATIEKIKIDYKGQPVSGRKLTVTSRIPIDIETAWNQVKKPSLLEFIAKGKVTFKPAGGKFPEIWQEGMTVSARMWLYGFIPFGGVHHLSVEKIDEENKVIQTREWDRAAKVWKHRIYMKEIEPGEIEYIDEIIIYGGFLTGFIALWSRQFYIHRQKRWHQVKHATI